MAYDLLVESGPATPATADRPSRSPAYRHVKHATPPTSGAATLFDSFQQSVKLYANEPCLGHRPVDAEGNAQEYKFMTYAEVATQVAQFASSMRACGLKKGDRVAVFGANCSEWMVAMQVRTRLQVHQHVCVRLWARTCAARMCQCRDLPGLSSERVATRHADAHVAQRTRIHTHVRAWAYKGTYKGTLCSMP